MYISNNYKVSQDIGQGLKLEFDMGNGRSQIVFVHHYLLWDGGESWAVVESPIGEVGQVDLELALAAIGDMVCGGLGMFANQFVTIRDAVPLDNLDINEFERPLALVTTSADRLESQLIGRDQF